MIYIKYKLNQNHKKLLKLLIYQNVITFGCYHFLTDSWHYFPQRLEVDWR